MSSPTQTLLAGTGRRCVNPPPNIAHGGWGAQQHEQAGGIDMDLWATALALFDGSTTAIIVDVDIQILTNERADQLRAAASKATGIPTQHIRACATHTHSGPVPYKSWIEKGYEMVEPWFENLACWCAEAASEALANLQPVEIRVGRGECHINANRRCVAPNGERFLGLNAEGACDHEVIAVRFDATDSEGRATRVPHDSEGRVTRVPNISVESGTRVTRPSEGDPIATLVNFACHPTIMGPSNRLLTPDFPGATKRVVEQAVGGRCLFLQGSAGDQGPCQGFIADTQVYRHLGAVLGHEAAKIILSLKAIPPKPKFREIIPSGAPLGMYDAEFPSLRGTPVQVLDREIFVPLRAGLPEKHAASQKLDLWKARLHTAREQNDAAAITEAIYMARRADIQLRMADDFGGKPTAGVRAHFITFGDVALVGCNIEPFCEVGMAIKQRSPCPVTFMCGYTNGRMAYMPTAEEWVKGGYEVENSPFGPDAAEVLQREVLATLRGLRNNT